MPTPEQILQSLAGIANQWRPLAVFWHAYLLVVVLRVLHPRPLSGASAGGLLTAPVVSVAVLAWMAGNPFNGLLFVLLAAAMIALAVHYRHRTFHPGRDWLVFPGGLLVVFGWVYPHFTDVSTVAEYLYAAPTGLIPCPTLSVTIGLSMLLGLARLRAWSLVLGAAGLLYGVYGAVRLGVALDWVLLAGALLLCAVGLARRQGHRGAAA